ncbi:MAG: hypothetical protein EXX96DRAFT_492337 [Benjaminiella poitrasii]|nr:MAG: hypothetical protein EXX96DRAFT_492337 [Benjaminiella poitrasii]
MTNVIRTHTPVEQQRILPVGTVFDYDNQGKAQRITLETPVQIQQQQPGTLAGEPQRVEEINEKAAAINSIQSLREGKLPTNKQLNKVIDRFLNSSILENNKKHLSSDGQTFIENFKELVAVLQTALEEKNHDELFQSMIYHIRKSEELLKVDQDKLRENQQQAQNEAQLGGQAILKIAKLFLFNAQFRNLLTQILTIAQQTMGGAIQAGGQKISNKISSSSEANNQDRDLAEGSHGNNKDSHGQNDDDERIRNATFAAMGGIGAATATGGGAYLANNRIHDSQDQQHDNSNLPDKHVDFLAHRFADPEPIASTTDDAGNSILTGELGQNVSRRPGDYDQKELNTGTTRELYGERLNHGTVLGHNREQQDIASDDLGSSSQNDNLMSNNSHKSDVSSSMKKMANKLNPQAMDDGKTNEKSSQQQDASVDEIITKLKEILTTVQKNPEYQKAIQTIVSLFNLWGSRLSSGQGMDRRKSSAVELSERGEYYKNTAAYEAKTIIEDWAQGKSMDPIIQKSTDLYNKLKADDTLHQLYDRVMVYIKQLLQEPGYLASDESTEEGKKLVEKSRQSTLEKYKPEINGLIQESSDIVQAISDDKTANDISEKVKAIHRTLWYDSNGNAAFKPHLLNDIRTTLIPAMIKLIKYVPLPQIVYSDKQYEIAVENMVLEGNSLMPDIFEIKMDDFLSFRPNFTVDYINSQSLNVRLIGIQTSMDDVIFYYKRKTGFPRLSDSGVISFKTGGAGMNISMRIGSDSIDQAHTFRIDQCHCMIDKLDIKVKHCKHDILYKVFNPMLTGIIKRQICKAVEDKITNTFRASDAKMTRRLWNKRLSGELGETSDNRRPGFFSHLVTVLNQKVANM